MSKVLRVVEDPAGAQVMVEYYPDTGHLHVAQRPDSFGVWGPPLREVRNEDQA